MTTQPAAHRSLFSRAWMAILVIDRSGIVVDANPPASRLTGRTRGELTGTPAHRHLPDGLCALFLERLGADPDTHVHAVSLLAPAGREQARIRVRAVAWLAAPGTPGAPGSEVVCCLLPAVPSPRLPVFPAPPPLSATEARIVEGLAFGLTNVELSRRLHLSRQGLDYHIDRLRRKLRVRGRTALVARAYVAGLLAPDAWPPRLCTARLVHRPRGSPPSPDG